MPIKLLFQSKIDSFEKVFLGYNTGGHHNRVTVYSVLIPKSKLISIGLCHLSYIIYMIAYPIALFHLPNY